jgi:hypothetical protein
MCAVLSQSTTSGRLISESPEVVKPVIENFIHSFGGVSYSTEELLLGKFGSPQVAEDCAAEVVYLYRFLPIETDGEWMAVYFD